MMNINNPNVKTHESIQRLPPMITMIIFILCLLFPISSLCQIISPSVKQDLLAELNAIRKNPLVYADDQQINCDRWAKKISTSYRHASHGFTGETIGAFIAVEQIIPAFMESKAHKKILLDKRVSRVAVGVYVVPESTEVTKDGIIYNPKTYYTVIRTYH